MSREDIIRMAREAGFREDVFAAGPRKGKVSIFDYGDVDILGNLDRFASLVAAAKQEECAKVCADHPGHIPSNKWNASSALGSCEQAIRALK